MKPVCLGLFVLLVISLVGCSSKPLPTFEILAARDGDQVTSEISNAEVRFDIQSESGTGNAEVKLASGEWPEKVFLRAHGSGLERLRFSYPGTVIEVSISNGGDRKVLRSVMEIGEDIQSAGEETAFYMPVEIDEQGGWIEVQTPAKFHEIAPKAFHIEWID